MSRRSLFGNTPQALFIESEDGSVEVERDYNRINLKVNATGVTGGTLGSLAYKNSVSYPTEVTSKPDLTVYELKTNLKALAYKDNVDYVTELLNKPDLTLYSRWDQLGDLATKTQADYNLDILNRPDLSVYELKGALRALAYKDAVDYATTDVTNKPTLGTLSTKNAVDYATTDIVNKPTLGSLAAKSSIDYASTDLTNKPTLGTLAAKNAVDWNTTEIINKPTIPDVSGYQPLHQNLTDLSDATPSINMNVSLNQTTTIGSTRTGSGTTAAMNVLTVPGNSYTVNDAFVQNYYTAQIASNTLARTSAGTHSLAATVFIAGAPSVGSNTTFLNSYALYVSSQGTSGTNNPGSLRGIYTNGGMVTNNHILPFTNGSWDLGSTALRFRTAYLQNINFSGTLTGDIYANMKPKLVAGDNITLVADDSDNTITVNSSIQDTSGSLGALASRDSVDWNSTTDIVNKPPYISTTTRMLAAGTSTTTTTRVTLPPSPVTATGVGQTQGAYTVTVTADSSYAAGWEAHRAFDKDAATAWESAISPLPHWIQLQVNPPVAVVQMMVKTDATDSSTDDKGRLSLQARAPKTGRLEGSNDGVNWSGALDASGEWTGTFTNANNYQVFSNYSGDTAYSYYRFTITSCNSNLVHPRIAELELYADITTTSTTTATTDNVALISLPVLESPQITGTVTGPISLVPFPGHVHSFYTFGEDTNSGLGRAGQAGQFFTGTAAGDTCVISYDKTLRLGEGGGSAQLSLNSTEVIFATNTIRPISDAVTYLGTSGFRWGVVYSQNGVLTTSDENEKQDIVPLEAGLDFVNRLEPIRFRFKTGSVDTVHMGLGARSTRRLLEEEGMEAYGLVDGKDEPWGMNYSELVAPLIKAVQQLTQRVVELETRLAGVEGLESIKGQLG